MGTLDFRDSFFFLLYKWSSEGKHSHKRNPTHENCWQNLTGIVSHKDDKREKQKYCVIYKKKPQYFKFELLDWLNICEHCNPYAPHLDFAKALAAQLCVCVCASGWHHTVACWEGLLHPHGIYNIYSPPEQMSSLSHSVWLAALHTGAPTKQKVAQKLPRQSVPHPPAWTFLFSSLCLHPAF